ncbi:MULTISPECIES: hypothetical protein [unclassified Fusobacterium]|uniref:hypothetical protein n=1 Tax=unclassified Fusobacterium TaxID=2648384 RepID=UPI001B8D54CE|nr:MULTISPECIES: hypothetical protein [unclassified Fusobacterium]MBR8701042.1 hypothetical protein [Fusobacterium sp. DD45]MBR8710814.1 hypothetical protein [Fusobacterium sp. DD28]MBR8751408.1 hypothetical protein [Fusobacterium sp. DD26]
MDNLYQEIRFMKKKSLLILKKFNDKDNFFIEMVNILDNENERRYDYANKVVFSFSPIESAKIVREIEKHMSGSTRINSDLVFTHTIDYPIPQKIYLHFSSFQGILSLTIDIYLLDDENKKFRIYLDEFEMEILKENLKSQYNLFNRHCTEYKDK